MPPRTLTFQRPAAATERHQVHREKTLRGLQRAVSASVAGSRAGETFLQMRRRADWGRPEARQSGRDMVRVADDPR